MSDQQRSGKKPDDRSPQQIEQDLAATREELEETLGALGDKLDVKARAASWAEDTAARTKHSAAVLTDDHGPELAVAVGVAIVVVALLIRRARAR